MRGEVLKGHLDLILLAALESKPAYGYALIKDLQERTEGRLQLTEGTIYPVLHRLQKAGFLESRIVTVQSRRRRVYHLTPAGRRELQTLLAEWSQFASGVENLLRQHRERG